VPERVEYALRGAVGNAIDKLFASTRKSDRLPPAAELNSLRRVIRVTTTSRGPNNREIVRVRPFVRVAGNLSMTVSDLSANIPPFNAQKMMLADAAPGANADDSPDAELDAEVLFTLRDLAGVLPRVKIAAVLSQDEVLMRVRDAVTTTGSVPSRAPAPE